MSGDKIREEMRTLAIQVKRSLNAITIILLGFIAYSINQWHDLMGIDKFINLVTLLLIIVISIKLYLNYINLNPSDIEAHNERIYKQRKREYYELLRLALWLTVAIFILRLIS